MRRGVPQTKAGPVDGRSKPKLSCPCGLIVVSVSRVLADHHFARRHHKCGSVGSPALKMGARAYLMAAPVAKVHRVHLAGYPGFHSRSVSILVLEGQSLSLSGALAPSQESDL